MWLLVANDDLGGRLIELHHMIILGFHKHDLEPSQCLQPRDFDPRCCTDFCAAVAPEGVDLLYRRHPVTIAHLPGALLRKEESARLELAGESKCRDPKRSKVKQTS